MKTNRSNAKYQLRVDIGWCPPVLSEYSLSDLDKLHPERRGEGAIRCCILYHLLLHRFRLGQVLEFILHFNIFWAVKPSLMPVDICTRRRGGSNSLSIAAEHPSICRSQRARTYCEHPLGLVPPLRTRNRSVLLEIVLKYSCVFALGYFGHGLCLVSQTKGTVKKRTISPKYTVLPPSARKRRRSKR